MSSIKITKSSSKTQSKSGFFIISFSGSSHTVQSDVRDRHYLPPQLQFTLWPNSYIYFCAQIKGSKSLIHSFIILNSAQVLLLSLNPFYLPDIQLVVPLCPLFTFNTMPFFSEVQFWFWSFL
jgi:hypothetical protein